MFYIQNRNAGYLGNAPVFWAKERRGYTANLNNAEKFTEEEAKKICQGNPEKNIAWPVEYIDISEGIQRVIDCQALDHSHVKTFE